MINGFCKKFKDKRFWLYSFEIKNMLIYKNRFYYEIALFVAMFFLTLLHEWMFIDSLEKLSKAIVLFLFLYIPAQIHRFFIYTLLVQRKYISYFLLSQGFILFFSILLLLINYLWINPDYYQKANILTSFLYQYALCTISTFTVTAVSLMWKYSVTAQKLKEQSELLNDMNIRLLYSQLNPHFLFNMLNNLYGVSLTEPSRTPDLILKLSNVMRYHIEAINKEEVALSEEIQLIESYINLEEERIGKRCEIVFKHPDLETATKYSIATSVLLSIIENGFKHSVNHKKWFVHIHLELLENSLAVEIINSLPDERLIKKSTGVGLKNLQERLNILYQNKYEFRTEKTNKTYKTTLNIKLKKT